jgi:hypothetical protein
MAASRHKLPFHNRSFRELSPRHMTRANSWLAERVHSATRNIGLPLTLHRVQFSLLTLVWIFFERRAQELNLADILD